MIILLCFFGVIVLEISVEVIGSFFFKFILIKN